jgi:hypothetical protein
MFDIQNGMKHEMAKTDLEAAIARKLVKGEECQR